MKIKLLKNVSLCYATRSIKENNITGEDYILLENLISELIHLERVASNPYSPEFEKYIIGKYSFGNIIYIIKIVFAQNALGNVNIKKY